MKLFFFLLIPAQVPDSDEQFVPDFHSENCEYSTFNTFVQRVNVLYVCPHH